MTDRGSQPPTALAQTVDPDAGVVNFRDLGGLPLRRGGVTRYGQIYRSDAPFHRDDLPVGVRHLKWATVIDLRSPREFGADVAWGHEGRHERVPLLRSAAPEALEGDLPGLYAHMARHAGHAVARIVEFVGSCDGPTLVHCTFGKDRTGVVAAVLQVLAGVERSATVTDYTLSRRNSHAAMARLIARGFQPRRTMREEHFAAPAAAINAVLDVLDARPGGVRGYLWDHGASLTAVEAAASRLNASGCSSGSPV